MHDEPLPRAEPAPGPVRTLVGPSSAAPRDLVDPAAPAPPPLLPDHEPQLVVSLGSALYAIPIGSIEEILPMRQVAPLPRSTPAVRGVLFLRGHPVTVLDLGLLLGMEPVRGARIVVLVIEEERYGLIVDGVHKVASPGTLTDPAPPPALLEASPALRGVARLGEEIVSLLDVEHLIPAAPGARAGA